MTRPAFELLSDEQARIGDSIVKVCHCNPALDGKWKYSIEATSDDRDTIVQKLRLHELRDIRPPDIPNGTAIMIQRPRTEFRELQFADIRKFNDCSEMHVTMVFDFVDWHLPISLQHFAESYCDAMLKLVEGAKSTHFVATEAGLFITCEVSVPATVDFWNAYKKIDAQVLATYRKCIADTYIPKSEILVQTSASQPAQPTDAHGTRWWIRYVLVPIVGSGTFAAVIAGLMAFLK